MQQLSFQKKLSRLKKIHASTLCVGLDFHPELFAQHIHQKNDLSSWDKFLKRLFPILKKHGIFILKFQSAFYEMYGAKGFAYLKRHLDLSQKMGFLRILDVKRSDIASTMRAYGIFAYEHLNCDAMTVVPYFGEDALIPILPWVEKNHGVFMVLLSSSPKSALVYERTASYLSRLFQLHQKKLKNNLGYVVGIQHFLTQKYKKILTSIKDQPILIPGIGFQNKNTPFINYEKIFKNYSYPIFNISRELLYKGQIEDQIIYFKNQLPKF